MLEPLVLISPLLSRMLEALVLAAVETVWIPAELTLIAEMFVLTAAETV